MALLNNQLNEFNQETEVWIIGGDQTEETQDNQTLNEIQCGDDLQSNCELRLSETNAQPNLTNQPLTDVNCNDSKKELELKVVSGKLLSKIPKSESFLTHLASLNQITKKHHLQSDSCEGVATDPEDEKEANSQRAKVSRLATASRRFRSRKSLSMLELQRNKVRARRTICNNANSQEAGDTNDGTVASDASKSHNYSFWHEEDRKQFKPAGMKIMYCVILNAWRKRRDDVQRLNEDIKKYVAKITNIKHQLCAVTTLYSKEQSLHEKALSEIRQLRTQLDQNKRIMCELNSENRMLTTTLEEKAKSFDMLNTSWMNKQNEINDLKIVCRDYKHELDATKLKNFDAQKELDLLNGKVKFITDNYENRINQLNEQLETLCKSNEYYKEQGNALEKRLNDLKSKEEQVREYQRIDNAQREMINALSLQIMQLRHQLNGTISYRLGRFMYKLPDISLWYLHMFGYYLLPAIPPPKKSRSKSILNIQDEYDEIETSYIKFVASN